MGGMGGGGQMGGPPPQMGGGMGAPPGGPGGGGGGMSPGLQQAAQAIMQIEDPAELAAIGQLIMKKGEELMGGGQGQPQGGGMPPGGAMPQGPGPGMERAGPPMEF